jgi:hypothetical protein
MTAFRLTEMDRNVLAHIQQQMGLPSKAAALRYALRQYAKREKFNLPKPSRSKKKQAAR